MPTTLSRGQVAIIGVNTEDTGNPQRDFISFVLLAPITTGTVIFFTDRSWNGTTFSASGGADAGDGTFTYTAAGNLAAGTVITINQAQLTAAGMALDQDGDTIYVYQGTNANTPTTFLHAVELADGNGTFNGSLVNTGLVAGTSALAIADDNAEFGGRTHNIGMTDLFVRLNTTSRWVHNENSPQDGTVGINAVTGTGTPDPAFTAPDAQLWVAGSGGGEAIVTINLDGTYAAGTLGYQIVHAFQNDANLFHPSDISLDTVHGKFFFADSDATGHNRIVEGSISQLLNNPGDPATFNILYSNALSGSNGIIASLSVDTANGLIYFDIGNSSTGSSINKITYSLSGVSTSGQTPTQLASLGNGHFVTQMAIDYVHGTVIVGTTRIIAVFGTDVVEQNYVYRATGLTSASASLTFTELPFNPDDNDAGGPNNANIPGLPGEAWPVERGTIQAIDIDEVNQVLYIATGAVSLDVSAAQDGSQMQSFPGGVYSYALIGNAAGNVTTLFTQNFVNGPVGLMDYIEVDPATGRYYVTDMVGTSADPGDQSVWTGSLTVAQTPTLVALVGNLNSLGPQGLEIQHAPVLTGASLAATFTETGGNPSPNGTPVTTAGTFNTTDVDSGAAANGDHLAGAQVRISGNFQSGAGHADQLLVSSFTTGTNQSGTIVIGGDTVTFSYNAAIGVMTFTGVTTLDNYENVIGRIQFRTDGDNPTAFGTAGTRTISYSTFDGLLYSDEIHANVTVTGVNDAPVNTPGAAMNFNEDTTGNVGAEGVPPTPVSNAVTGISVFDVDADPATQDITVTLAVGVGTLSIRTNVAGGIQASDVISGNGTGTIVITATQNEINTTLAAMSPAFTGPPAVAAAPNGLIYTPPANYNGATNLTITTNDNGFNGNDPGLTGTGTSEQDQDVKVINIADVNDAPTIGDGTETSPTIFEDQPLNQAAAPVAPTVATLFGGQFADAVDIQVTGGNPTGSVGDTFAGIAIVADGSAPASGQWEYWNGSAWTDIGAAALATARTFTAATQIRFNPALNFNGAAPTLTVHLIETGGAAITNNGTVNLSAGGATGGATVYSAGTVVLSQAITPVNDAPTSTNLSGDVATYTEGAASALLDLGSNLTVADIDSPNFDTGTLTVHIGTGLVAAQDQLGISAVGGVTSTATTVSVGGIQIATYTGGGAGGGDLVFTFDADATPAAVQALMRAINYSNSGGDAPTAGSRTINWTLVDGDGTANSGTDTLAVTSSVNVVAVNDAPAGTDHTASFNEDSTYTFAAADFGYSDVDGNNFSGVRFTTLPALGTIFLDTDGPGGAAPIAVGAGNIVALSEINAGHVYYVPVANGNGVGYANFTFQVRDDGGVLNGGVDLDQSANTFTFDVASVNDGPTSTNLNGDAVTFTEGAASVLLDLGSNATIADLDSANFDTGTLTVHIGTGLVAAQDQLIINAVGGVTFDATTVSVGGIQIATYVGGGAGGGDLVFTFDADATPAAVQALVRAIGYANSGGDTPTGGARTINWTLVDGDGTLNGGVDTLAQTTSVNVVAVNDAPAGLDHLASLNEDGTYILATADFGYSDVDGNNFAGVVLTTLPALGTLRLNGVAITVAGTFINATDIGNSLLTYQPATNGNGTNYASFTFQVRDDGGVLNGGVDTDQSANTFTFDVASVNDGPTATNLNGDAVTWTEGDGTTLLDLGSNATIADMDSANFDTGTLTVHIGTGLVAAQDQLVLSAVGGVTFDATTVSVGGIQIATYVGGGAGGGDLVFTFDADATPAAVQALVRAIGYTNTGGISPSAGTRTINWTLVDGDGTLNGGVDTLAQTTSVNVISINDAPAGTDASYVINEDATYTFAEASFGFGDVNGDDFAGVLVTTIPVPGTLFYDADGAGVGAPVAVTAGQFISASEIALGHLYYTPLANQSGAPFTSFTFQVRDDGGTAAGGIDTDQSANTITFDVTAQNDAPINTVPGGQTINEDSGFTLSTGNGNAISVSDVDATTLTMTLSVAHGTLTLASTAGLTFGTGDGTGDTTMTFSGTAAAINAALGSGLSYVANADFNGSDAISVQTTDNGETGAGGTQIDGDSVSIAITAINDAPVVIGDGTESATTIDEDTPGAGQTIQALFSGQYSDAADNQIPHGGASSPGQFSGIAVTANGSSGATGQWQYFSGGVWTDIGAVSDASAKLLGDPFVTLIRFNPAPDFNGPAPTLTVHLIDNSLPFGIVNGMVVDASVTGGTTAYSSGTVVLSQDVTAVNDAPVNSVPGAQTINEDGSFTLSTGNGNAISVADVDATTLSVTLSVANGTLTLASTAGLSFGTGDGTGDVTMTFSGSAAAINAALGSGLTYNPTANYNGSDAISVVTTDAGQTGTGPVGTDTDSVAITINSVNDAPSGAANTVTGSEDDPYVFTAADFGFTDPADGNAFLAISVITFPANGTLFLDSDGPGGAAPIDLSTVGSGAFVGIADINAGHLYFQPDADEYGDNYATFTFKVQDDGGITNGGVDLDPTARTMTIDIDPDNLPPVVDLDGATGGVDYTTTFVEDGAAVAIGAGVLVSDPDSGLGDLIESATITLTDRVADDSLTLTGALPPGLVANTTNLPGSITIQITGPGTGAQYQALIQSIQYATISQDPTQGGADLTRTVTVIVNDGTIDSATATTTINVTAIDDAPEAKPDLVITDEATVLNGDVFANNTLGADSDVDGPSLTVTEVNGNSGAVGTQITLASGALLTLNADGTFEYDPNGAFDFTPIPASGASNTPSHDSFIYTLAGGVTASVSVQIDGLDTNDLLYGTAGADMLAGGGGNDYVDGLEGADNMSGEAGNDTYAVDDSADVVNEAVGQGTDIVYAQVSYELAAAAEIEILSAFDQSGIAPLALVGNGFDQLIFGNDGFNFLEGNGGADYLIGLDGSDVYVVEGGDDVIVEGAGGGADVVYARDDYTLSANADVEFMSAISQDATTPVALVGNGFDQIIWGNAGANYLEGGGGADVLVGLAGNDTYVVDSADDYVAESAGGGNDVVYATANYALFEHQEIEVLSTVSQAATTAIDLTGNNLANILFGNDGNNVLDGKGGNDALIGLGGADRYTFSTALGAGNVDQIYGFEIGTDKIVLDHNIFEGLAFGTLTPSVFVAGTETADEDQRIVYDQTTGALYYDLDGVGGAAAVHFATLIGAPPITASDILVI